MYADLPVDIEALREMYRKELGADPARVHAILQDFYAALSNDPMLGFFFAGKDIQAISRKQEEFLLRAMGARPTYSGKPPAQAHLSLAPILSGHFDRRLKLLEETLQKHGLPEEAIRIWLGFENAFRNPILRT